MAMPKWFQIFRNEGNVQELEARESVHPNAEGEVIDVGDKVLFRATYGEYVAKVVGISPTTRYVPTRYHLHVWTENDLLTWVWCDEDRITVIEKASALRLPAEADAISA